MITHREGDSEGGTQGCTGCGQIARGQPLCMEQMPCKPNTHACCISLISAEDYLKEGAKHSSQIANFSKQGLAL